mmetsp:Transcript_6051/g.20648  ORF Transcript_6051/g.20648 Transcript_6051/m.20648 type:complete len:107 (+) Transcript_6051:86-406(+)
MSDYKSAVVGGKLNLKGKKKKRKAAAAPAFVELAAPAESSEPARDGEGHLTDAERRHKKRFLEKRKGEVEKSVEASHRSRVDEFNDKLASLTEHNDIPRISAAGNG